MILDKRALEMLLSLDDVQFLAVIKKLAKDAGIDPSLIEPDPAKLAGIRKALAGATDSDIARASELLKNYKSGKSGK